MQYQIRQLGVGGILDQGITLLKNHLGLLVGIFGTTVIPIQVLFGFLQASAIQSSNVGLIGVLGLLSMLVAFILIPIVNAAVINAIASVYLSRKTSIGECFRFGARRYFAVLWTQILYGFAIMGGFILLVIPGFIVILFCMLSQHVAILEGINGGAALKRSWQLVSKNALTGFVLCLVLGAINIGFSMGGQFIPEVYTKTIVVNLLTTATSLLGACVFVVYYFSCRCKVENFDLQILAESIGEQPVDNVQLAEEV